MPTMEGGREADFFVPMEHRDERGRGENDTFSSVQARSDDFLVDDDDEELFLDLDSDDGDPQSRGSECGNGGDSDQNGACKGTHAC